jgi:hypothetical protein
MAKTAWGIMLLIVVALAIAACGEQPRAAVQTLVAARVAEKSGIAVTAAPTALSSPTAAATPEFSALSTPTPLPTMGGIMGTLTAIAPLVASPTQDAQPYVIVNRGNPHFLEFHAWW